MSKMVTHAKLQYYRHNYCLVCMTGLLGCRWHRYKQSTRDSRKRDLFWFTLFTLTFLYIIFYFYFWLIAKNDFDDLNWHMFKSIKTWIPWYRILLGLVCASFAYCIIVMCLCLCHVLHGHQLYMHPIHIVIIVLTLAACVAMTVVLDDQWQTEWTVIWLSLQITGPFLQVGSVVLMTSLTWLISQQWFKLSHWGIKVAWLIAYLAIMIGLYICPLYINSPCVIQITQLPPKPRILAHRGASGIAPENTLIAFQLASQHDVYGFESDVMISYDGVPFLMHDDTLRRTTNVASKFPHLVDENAAYLNISDLRELDAGSWYLQHDPFGVASSLSEERRKQYANQSIPTLTEFIQLAKKEKKTVLFDLRLPPSDHPYHNDTLNVTLEAIYKGGIPRHKVWLLEYTWNHSRPLGMVLVAEEFRPVKDLQRMNISHVNVQYTEITGSQIDLYRHANISTNIWTINSKWFFSLYWCMGVSSITTNMCHELKDLTSPVWHLAPTSYLILWVTVDVLSAVIVVTVFIVQRVRLFGTNFSPETVSLNTRRPANRPERIGTVPIFTFQVCTRGNRTYRSRTMKQKLLTDTAPDPFDDIETTGNMGVVNRPAPSYSMASISNDTYGTGLQENEQAHPDARYEIE